MHLIVPFASLLGDEAPSVLGDLDLPHLAALLHRLAVESTDRGDESSYSPPHERALARALGLTGGDGAIPWAARHARADGIETSDLAWGELTPVHWMVGRDHLKLADPATLELDDAASRELFDAVRPLFVDEGFAFEYGAPLRWYAAHESLAQLRCASLDRAIGRNLQAWTPEGPGARLVRRLQNEVQMLLYQHPQHDRHVAAGRLPVNSVWLSGCGVAADGARQGDAGPAVPLADLVVDDSLRRAALRGDWASWSDAWRALDAGPLRTALDRCGDRLPVRVVLCGERSSVTLGPEGSRWFDRLRRRLNAPSPQTVLAEL